MLRKLNEILSGSALVFSTLALTACGDSGDSSPTTPPPDNPPSMTKISGRVAADGYLSGATVCLDTSRNKKCDTGEPSTTSLGGGAYELLDISQADASAYPVVAEVVVGSIDENTPATPVTSKFTLTTPAGKHAFVSPVTTMTQSRIDANPSLTPDNAESLVKTAMGYTANSNVSLSSDYVAAAADTANPAASEYGKIRDVAKVTAAVLEAHQQVLEDAALTANLDTNLVTDSLVNLVIEQVFLELPVITADPVNYNTATIDAAIATETADIVVAVQHQEFVQSSTAVSDLQTLMTTGGGIYWLYGWTDGTIYDLIYSNETIVNGVVTFADYEYTSVNPIWTTLPFDPAYTTVALGGAGWVTTTSSETVTFNSDGTMTWIHGLESETFSLSEVDVSGTLVIDSVVDNVWRQVVNPTATFSAGAKVYQESYSWDQDVYQLVFSNFQSQCQAAGIPYVDTTTNCHSVLDHNNFLAYTTLEAVFSTSLTDTTWIMDVLNSITIPNSTSGAVKLIRPNAMDTSGVASYGYIDTVGNYVEVVASTWNRVTMNGVDMVLLDIPPAVRPLLSVSNKAANIIFAIQDGYLRRGYYVPAAYVGTETSYSATAMQDLLNNVALP